MSRATDSRFRTSSKLSRVSHCHEACGFCKCIARYDATRHSMSDRERHNWYRRYLLTSRRCEQCGKWNRECKRLAENACKKSFVTAISLIESNVLCKMPRNKKHIAQYTIMYLIYFIDRLLLLIPYHARSLIFYSNAIILENAQYNIFTYLTHRVIFHFVRHNAPWWRKT